VSDIISRKEVRAMTRQQALTEARRRWGKKAAVQEMHPSILKKYPNALRFCVGVIFFGMALMVKGQGHNWKECFEDADQKGR